MIIRRGSETAPFAADAAMTIKPLLPGESAHASLVTGHLDGLHSSRVNRCSEKLYLVVSGRMAVATDSGESQLGQGDAVLVSVGESVELYGENAEIVIVCTPAFKQEDEELL